MQTAWVDSDKLSYGLNCSYSAVMSTSHRKNMQDIRVFQIIIHFSRVFDQSKSQDTPCVANDMVLANL